MARELLGDVIDIHSGGEDNIFPHHECEIAQSRCATGEDRFARYWFHPRFLMVEGKKMSKSAGNFFTVRDLMGKGFAPDAIRLELIKTHYRANANFTEQGLKDAKRMCEKWRAFLEKADASAKDGSRDEGVAGAFAGAMDDDLNVAGAIGVVASWVNETPEPDPRRRGADARDRRRAGRPRTREAHRRKAGRTRTRTRRSSSSSRRARRRGRQGFRGGRPHPRRAGRDGRRRRGHGGRREMDAEGDAVETGTRITRQEDDAWRRPVQSEP